MNINEALAKLDPSDDAHWTNDGMPRMDVLQKLTFTPDLSRTQVTNAAPDFTRESAMEADTVEPVEDENVEASAETPEASEASETPEKVIEVQKAGDFEISAGGDVIVEAVEPDVVALEATPGETVTVTPVDPEIAISAPEKPVTAPETKLEALQAALAVHTEAMNEADSVKKASVKAFNASSDQVNELNRQIDAVTKADPLAATAGIRDYIAKQNEIRADRAARANAFMGKTGARPGDVAKVLEVRSPLDKAYLGRKPPRGSKRPQVRVPQD